MKILARLLEIERSFSTSQRPHLIELRRQALFLATRAAASNPLDFGHRF
jgi:hypothetical protein